MLLYILGQETRSFFHNFFKFSKFINIKLSQNLILSNAILKSTQDTCDGFKFSSHFSLFPDKQKG